VSRYVQLELPVATLEEVAAALDALDIPCERAVSRERIMLEGSLECAGEPVDIRIAPGTDGTVEDFGFRREGSGTRLICGEYDERLLAAGFVPRVSRTISLLRSRAAAERQGLQIEEQVEPDGTRRLLLKPR
jgi:hypothetical protein